MATDRASSVFRFELIELDLMISRLKVASSWIFFVRCLCW